MSPTDVAQACVRVRWLFQTFPGGGRGRGGWPVLFRSSKVKYQPRKEEKEGARGGLTPFKFRWDLAALAAMLCCFNFVLSVCLSCFVLFCPSPNKATQATFLPRQLPFFFKSTLLFGML